jgi:hypothetical protein
MISSASNAIQQLNVPHFVFSKKERCLFSVVLLLHAFPQTVGTKEYEVLV